MLSRLLLRWLQTPRSQPRCERWHRFLLRAMNFGGGADVRASGETVVIDQLAQLVRGRDSACVFDVGANVGDYARALAQALGSTAIIHCFEPARATFDTLTRNVAGLANVRAYNLGLGTAEQRATLYSNAAGSGLASVYRRRLDHFQIAMDHTEEIEIQTLDAFCTEHGIDHIDLLKLDVEGHELSVLQGAQQTLAAGRIDLIQFEFGGCNIDSRTYFQDFFYCLNPQYRLHRILPRGLTPIERYAETYEVFITTNYLAINRALPER